ncbi:MAG: winged helix-turn-helix domain-containing protein [Sulfolobales archaeon]
MIWKLKIMLTILTITLLLQPALHAEVNTSRTEYLYRLGSEGYAYVSVFIDGVREEGIIYVKVEDSIIEESIVAVNEFNELLPAELVDGDIVIIYNIGNSEKVIVNYVARAATIREAYIDVVISPGGPSKVLLPKSSALLYLNGSADVSFTDTAITLTYSRGGTYLISYIPLTFIGNTTSPIVNATAVASPPPWYPIPLLLGASLAGVIYYLLRRRKPSAGEEVELLEYDVRTLKSEIDERDIEILRVVSTKELTISGLARELGLSKSVAWRRIRKLSHLKLITTTDVGGKTYIKVTPLGREVLEGISKKE